MNIQIVLWEVANVQTVLVGSSECTISFSGEQRMYNLISSGAGENAIKTVLIVLSESPSVLKVRR